MSFPPPNGPPGSDASGPSGFGPPQGFGPPEPPAPPGYGPPAPPGGFGQPPGGPPGPYGPPPPGGGGGGNGGKIAAAIVGAVLVVGLLIGGVLVLGGGDDEEDKASDDTSQSADTEDGSESGSDPSSEPPNESAGPNEPAPPDASRAPDGPPTGSEPFPFVVLDPGQCYDHPALSSDVQEIKIRSCSEPHNGEVISNATLTGDYATEKDLQQEVLRLCKADASERLKELSPDGRTYYFYAIYPQLPTYENRGKDTISCSITLSNAPDGPKLQKPLPE